MSRSSYPDPSTDSDRADQEPQFYARAKRNYQPTEEGAIAFKKGDILAVFAADSSGWSASIHGEIRRGKVPASKKYYQTLSDQEVEDLLGVRRGDDDNSGSDEDEVKTQTHGAEKTPQRLLSEQGAATRVDVGVTATDDSSTSMRLEGNESGRKYNLQDVRCDGILDMTWADVMTSEDLGISLEDQVVVTHRAYGKVVLRRQWLRSEATADIRLPGPKESLARDIRELRALNHKYLLPFIGLWCIDEATFMVFPSTNNGTLPDYMKLNPLCDRQKLLSEAAEALSYLHKVGCVHRCIEGRSILVSDDVHARLSVPQLTDSKEDFGWADRIRWMSPEQLMGDPATPASDTYAFGITTAEILSGMMPFAESRNPVAVFRAVLRGERPSTEPKSSLTGESYERVWQAAVKCWSKEPGERPSMKQVARMLALVERVIVKDIEALGFGGHYGDMFVGNHEIHGKVALKRLRPQGTDNLEDTMRSFLREAETWSRLSHEFVLPLLGTCRIEGYLHMISPYVENGTLRRYVKNHPEADCIRLVCQDCGLTKIQPHGTLQLYETAEALSYLHSQELIHGDIKGANILVSSSVHALLCDFGLSKFATFNTTVQLKGAGTCRWQSPELMENNGGKTTRSDGWAFGMTIAEILTGEIPFAHYSSDYKVTYVLMTTNERPKMQPMSGPSGIPYYVAWRAAGLCWFKAPAERLPMAQIAELLRPSAISDEVDPKLGPHAAEDPQPTDCYCGALRPGEVIVCGGVNCQRNKFHLACLGMQQAPADWLCLDCEFGSDRSG